MKTKNIIYFLTEEDIQTVANYELDRNLSSEEIEMIRESISEKMNWYDSIAESISEKLI